MKTLAFDGTKMIETKPEKKEEPKTKAVKPSNKARKVAANK